MKRHTELSHFNLLLLETTSLLLYSEKDTTKQKLQGLEVAQKHIPSALLQATHGSNQCICPLRQDPELKSYSYECQKDLENI